MSRNGWFKLLGIVLIVLNIFIINLSETSIADFEFSNLELVTYKEIFEPKETIIITTNPELLNDDIKELLTLTIKTSSRIYNYIGVPEFPIKFNLPEPDTYTIQLVNKKTNEVISESVISTVAQTQEEKTQQETKEQEISEQEKTQQETQTKQSPIIINNPGGLILENHQRIKRPFAIEQVQTIRGPKLLLERPINSIERILIKGLRDETPPRLGIEDITIPIDIHDKPGVKTYAIDPTTMDFEEATITVTAEGTELFMCKEYDFEAQNCWGSWVKVRDLTPGEEYRITLTPEDPVFTETDSLSECSCTASFTGSGVQQTATISCSTSCAHVIDVPENAVSFHIESITFNTTYTRTHGAGNIQNDGGSQAGYYHDENDFTTGDEIVIGTDTVGDVGSTSITLTNDDIASSGVGSFTEDNCDNWPTSCTYYANITASADYRMPGGGERTITINYALDSITYDINTTEPGDFAVILQNPANNYYTNNSFPEFEYVPTDNTFDLVNCSIYTNETGWGIKNTSTNIQNGTSNYINAQFNSDGAYLWNIICFNENDDEARGLNNRTINIDTAPPLVNLVNPDNDETINDESIVNFYYNVSDASAISNCSLVVNDSVVSTSYSVQRDQEQQISHSLLNGHYEWNIMCYDVAGNSGEGIPRNITVNVPPKIYTGLWFETSTQDCEYIDSPCLIGLAQETDGTPNTISGAAPGSNLAITVLEAESPFISSNGGDLIAGSEIIFSSYFPLRSQRLRIQRSLYIKSSNGFLSEICEEDEITLLETSEGSCLVPSDNGDIRISSTDKLFYRIKVRVAQGGDEEFEHEIDHEDSFVNLTGFSQIGFLSALLIEPSAPLLTGQGEVFNVTCNVTCDQGSCLDTDVYVQTNESGSWVDVDDEIDRIIQLNTGQDNPEEEGTIFNTTNSVTFELLGGTPGTANVRCVADPKYLYATSNDEQITVSVTDEPVITLVYPENDSWINDEPVNFTFNPASFSNLDSCTLYIDGEENENLLSPSANSQNIISVSGLSETRHNWSVSCTDENDLVGNSTTFYFDIDRQAPYNLTVFNPLDDAIITREWVDFEWLVQDIRSDELTCEIFINETLNTTVVSQNDTLTNTTISGFSVGYYSWYMNCYDFANNVNTTETFYFNITDIPPVIELASPLNYTGINQSTAVLSYIPWDGFGINQCSLYLDDALVPEETDFDITPNEINTFEVEVEEEEYTWRVECLDTNSNPGISSTWIFFVDFTPPTIVLHNPLNDFYFAKSLISFSYTAYDNWPPLNCTINFNDEPNITTSTTSGTQVTETGTGYPDGFHDWNVMCVDVGGNSNVSETRTLTINESPIINQDSPINNAHVNSLIVNLFYTPIDNDGFEYCDLYLDGAYNQSNASSLFSNVQSNFSLINLDEGRYDWNVSCMDSGIFSNTNSSGNASFVVDRTPPTLELISPNESQTINTSTYNFSWITTDAFSSNMSCDLYLNEELNASNIVVENNSIFNYSVSGLRTRNYNWSVTCFDKAGNFNESDLINFEVMLPPKVTLLYPLNDTGDFFEEVYFGYIPSEGGGSFNSCSLIFDDEVFQTNDSIVAEEENYFIVTGLEDGTYEWNVQCTDNNLLVGKADESWIFYMDTEPPYYFELFNPLNNSLQTRNNVSFSFLVKDKVSPEMVCDVTAMYEEVPISIAEDILVQNDTVHTVNYLLIDGNYSWYVTCEDKATLSNVSDEFFFEIIAPPNVTLISPENSSWFNTDSVTLTYFPEDDFIIESCSLHINGELNATDSSISNKDNNTFTLNNLAQGEYNWSVACTDADSNTYMPPNYTFYVDLDAPSVILNNPLVDELFGSSTILFNWTVTDLLSPNMTCDLYIDEALNKENIIVGNDEDHVEIISGFDDGLFNWSVTCRDLATNENATLPRKFEVQEPPTVLLGDPFNNYRNNSVNMSLFFTAFDNSGFIDYCTLIVNEEEIENNTNVLVGEENYFNLTNLDDGSYAWDVVCFDPSGNEGKNETGKTFYVDLTPPVITLISPEVDGTFNQNDITFYWNATDFNESVLLSCDLYVTDPLGDRFVDNITGLSGETFNHTLLALEDGEHFWNVTCSDDLENSDTSETRRFIINQPDLYLDDSRISFSNDNPDLSETINITANVSNIGGVDAINALVGFWQGDPDEGGILIDNQTKNVSYDGYEVYWVLWEVPPGYHEIHVRADPENLIAELNETNNNATKNISVLSVEIHEPLNESVFNYDDINFNFTLQDYTFGLINYSVLIDGSPIGQEGQVNDGEATQISINVPEGIRDVTIRATDYLGRIKEATISIIVDLTPPVPVIVTENETWFNTSTPNINITITDNLDDNISYSLYVNDSVDVSGYLINNTVESLLLSTLSDGVYSLILEAVDEASNSANSSAITIFVDTLAPTIVLDYPDDGENFTTRDVWLNYTVFDNMAQEGVCFVNVSGTSYGPFDVAMGEQQSLFVEDLDEGAHYWNVTCSDEAGNSNISETRNFNIFIPPEITLISPLDNAWSNSSSNTFTYFVSDDTGIDQCYLYLNNVENQSSPANNNDNNTFVVNNMEGIYVWRVECEDSTIFNTRGVSDNRTLFVDLISPSAVITTENESWFNSAPEIDFVLTDNMASIINYTIFVNGSVNVEGTASNDTVTSRTLIGLDNDVYEVVIEAVDLASNSNFSNTRTIYHDDVPPIITLNYPGDENITDTNNVNLSFTPSDNMAQFLTCSVTLNDDIIEEDIIVNNDEEEIIELLGLSGGYYYWNVTCLDQATNSNTSDTWEFFVPVPDLSVNASEIYFSDNFPKENDEITLTATIRNLGVSPAEDFDVEFWASEVDVPGNKIGDTINVPLLNEDSFVNVSVNFTVPIGTTEIFVVVNPDQRVTEDNYDNNVASRNISVEFWHYALGTTDDTLRVTDASLGLLFDWNVDNSTGSNIYVTDFDSQISWTTLQALSRDTDDVLRVNHFELLDSALNSDTFGDSVNRTYTRNGEILETETFEIFGQTLENVPVVNSTTSENFKTGILWDYDESTDYSGTENVVFITTVNKNQLGYQNNFNDFEIRIPAPLRDYQGPDTERVIFYTEIK